MDHPHFRIFHSAYREREAERLVHQAGVLKFFGLLLLVACVAEPLRPLSLIALVLLLAAGSRSAESRVLRRENAAGAIATSSRRWVLVLRTFEDDHLWLPGSGWEPFVELIERELGVIGPSASLVNPHSGPPLVGPLQLPVKHTAEWENAVAASLSEAARVLVVLGEGMGLRREMDLIVERGTLPRCIFVMPPVSRRRAARRWEHFCGWLTEHGLGMPSGARNAYPLALTTTDGKHWQRHPLHLPARAWRRPRGLDYSVALREILSGGPVDRDAIASSQSWIVAACLWGVGGTLFLIMLLVGLSMPF